MQPDAFTHIVNQLKDKLFRLALRWLPDVAEAEDAVQEVFIKLWQQRDNLKEVQNLEAWSVRMTRNLCIDKLRARKMPQGEWYPGFDLPDQTLGADHQLAGAETIQDIRRLMQHLPDKQRQVMELRDLEDYSYQEICEALGISLSQVKINLFRARQQLREALSSRQMKQHGS
ncbi:MAG: sigma-70 family RNA polymerase sigma factor [Lewinellaceae bacterium]|nr:sigma-70 family RNA polymerase sigma factor [Lewinellaceae bacterium]